MNPETPNNHAMQLTHSARHSGCYRHANPPAVTAPEQQQAVTGNAALDGSPPVLIQTRQDAELCAAAQQTARLTLKPTASSARTAILVCPRPRLGFLALSLACDLAFFCRTASGHITGPFNPHRPACGFVQLNSFRNARRSDTTILRELEPP